MILPVFGIVSQVVATFSRKPMFGHLGMVFAMIAPALGAAIGATRDRGLPWPLGITSFDPA
jgi:hypothetical protein